VFFFYESTLQIEKKTVQQRKKARHKRIEKNKVKNKRAYKTKKKMVGKEKQFQHLAHNGRKQFEH
jgi:ribonuclease HI